VKIGVLVRLLDQVRDLAEDAHDVVAMVDRHRADLGGNPSAVRRQQDHGGVRDLGAADDLAREQLLARLVASGATTEVNWRPRTSPTMCFAARFSQRITPVASMW
jgi:hypothetical protein